MKLEFSRQIVEKFSNIKFRENSFSGSRLVPYGPDGRTDGHDEAWSILTVLGIKTRVLVLRLRYEICEFIQFCRATEKSHRTLLRME